MAGEYLIKRTDGDWFDIDVVNCEKTLVPKSLPWRRLDGGWGDFRIEAASCEISFSYEDPGIQVVFEDEDISSAAQRHQLLAEIIEI